MSAETMVDRTAAAIRELYFSEYRKAKDATSGNQNCNYGRQPVPHLDGGTTNYGRRFQPVWPKIARFFLTHGIDPQLMVTEYFAFQRGGKEPRPEDMMNSQALALYGSARKRQAEDVRLSCVAQRAHADTRFWCRAALHPSESPRENWRYVAVDPTALLTPLFRYCLALGAGADDIAALYKDRAFWQYLRSPKLYNEAMASEIPQEFRDEANRVIQAAAR